MVVDIFSKRTKNVLFPLLGFSLHIRKRFREKLEPDSGWKFQERKREDQGTRRYKASLH